LGAIGAPFTSATAELTTTNLPEAPGSVIGGTTTWFDATWDYRTGPGGSRQATVVCPYGLNGVSSPAGVPLGFLYDTTNTCNGSASVR
jgi:hypothetical protein